MSVEFREITPENFKECIELKVAVGQEKFVAPNLYSIAQSKIYPKTNPQAIYNEYKEMVGFVLYGFYDDMNRYYLHRLMIDAKFQGKGYGKAATLEVIEKMRLTEDCREFYLSFVPENTVAGRLYETVGFVKTGELDGNEIEMRYDLINNANPKSKI